MDINLYDILDYDYISADDGDEQGSYSDQYDVESNYSSHDSDSSLGHASHYTFFDNSNAENSIELEIQEQMFHLEENKLDRLYLQSNNNGCITMEMIVDSLKKKILNCWHFKTIYPEFLGLLGASGIKYLGVDFVEQEQASKLLGCLNISNSIRGLYFGFDESIVMDTILTFRIKNLLYLNIQGESSTSIYQRLAKIVTTCKSLLYLELFDDAAQLCECDEFCNAIANTCSLRFLKLVIPTSVEFLENITESLSTNKSITVFSLASFVEGVCPPLDVQKILSMNAGIEEIRFPNLEPLLKALENPENNHHSIIRFEADSYCKCNKKSIIVKSLVEKNVLAQKLNNYSASDILRLSKLLIMLPMAYELQVFILQTLIPKRTLKNDCVVLLRVLLDRSMIHRISCPFEFTYLELIRRCYLVLKISTEEEYDHCVIEAEALNLASPEWFLSVKRQATVRDRYSYRF